MSDPASQNSIAGKGWYDCDSQFKSGAGIGPPGTVPHFIDLILQGRLDARGGERQDRAASRETKGL